MIEMTMRALSTVIAVTRSGSRYELSAYDGRANRITLKALKASLVIPASPRRGDIALTDAREGFTVGTARVTDVGALLMTIHPYPNGWCGTPEDHQQAPLPITTSPIENEEEVRAWLEGLS